MSTAAPPPLVHSSTVQDSQRRLRNPLERLRRSIRHYVTIEGVGIFLLCVLLLFWIGIVSDYGFFKVSGFDWLDSIPWYIRGGVLVIATVSVIGLAVWTILGGLLKRFSDPQMALLLERKFPNQLGDRLITAVEMSDPKKASELGFSRIMLEKTIHDAATEVEKLPLHRVFDWSRLIRKASRMLGMAVSFYLLALALFCMGRWYTYAREDLIAGLVPLSLYLLAGGVFALALSVWNGRVREGKGLRLSSVVGPGLLCTYLFVGAVVIPLLIALSVGMAGLVPALALSLLLLGGCGICGGLLLLKKGPTARLLGGSLALVLLLGGIGAFSFASANSESKTMRGINDFHTVSTIWLDREVKLLNEPWHRRAQLKIIGPDKKDIKVGFDAPPPSLRVRGYVYLASTKDSAYATGWRPMLWSDLKSHFKDGVPEPLADWQPREREGLTVDEVALHLERLLVRKEAGWQKRVGSEWEPLRWDDLRTAAFAAGDNAVPPLPGDWDPKAMPYFVGVVVGSASAPGPTWGGLQAAIPTANGPGQIDLIVDDVQTRLATENKDAAAPVPAVRAALGRLQRWLELQEMLARLDRHIDDWSMSRRLRKLDLPQQLEVTSWNSESRNTMMLDKGADNEYTGTFNNLKIGKVEYYVRGEDFTTDTRSIDVLGAPTLPTLDIQQRQPAYLFYRPESSDPAKPDSLILGKKQLFNAKSYAGYAGDQVEIKVPGGTDVLISARANKNLSSVKLIPGKNAQAPKTPKEIPFEGDAFQLQFDDVRLEHSFNLVFVDEDGVTGNRAFKIKPIDDQPPELPEIKPHPSIRLVEKEGYMVTVDARVPFVGRVTDDNGLALVQYAYNLEKIEAGNLVSTEAVGLIAAATGGAALHEAPWAVLVNSFAGGVESKKPIVPQVSNLKGGTKYTTIPGFLAELALEKPVPRLLVQESLATPQEMPYRIKQITKNFELRRDPWESVTDRRDCDFPVYSLDLKAKEGTLQPRYRMLLWVEATDTDIESEKDKKTGLPRPHLSTSKDKFPFVIVSEKDLLVEIGKQEEKIYAKLDAVLSELLKTQAKLDEMSVELAQQRIKPLELEAKSARIDDYVNPLDKGFSEISNQGLAPYLLILEEMKLNQVDPGFTGIRKKVDDTVVKPLRQLVAADDGNFKLTLDSLALLKSELDKGRAITDGDPAFQDQLLVVRAASAKAKLELRALITRLNTVLSGMQGIIDIKKLIEELLRLEKAEQQEEERYKELKNKILREQGLIP